MKTLILAGGRGTRLWPLSRQYKPKQFQKLFGDKTMLQETVSRVRPFCSWADIYISTNRQYFREVKSQLPSLPTKNIILEPAYRERIAAILLFIAYLKKEDLFEPVLVLPSDHLIKKESQFIHAALAGISFIKGNPDYILIFGEKPTFPDTGLGYAQKGRFLTRSNNFKIYQAPFFKEKPNLRRTKEYLKTKQYFWNTAIYLFTPYLIEKLTKKFIPDNYIRYQKLRAAFGKRNFKQILEKEYLEMDVASLEYSVIENYNKIALLPLSMGWSDIGSWTVLKSCLSSPNKNFIKGNYIGIDSKNIMVYGPSDTLVTSVGIKDLIIAVTDDIILVCHKDSSQRVKELIKKLEKNKKFDYI